MATNQLSDRDRGDIMLAVDRLFGRVIKHLPCPLHTMDERRDLHWCTLSEQQVQALVELHDFQREIFYTRSGVKIAVHNLDLHLTKVDSDDDGYFWGAPTNYEVPIPEATVMARIPKSRALFEWLDLTSDLGRQIVVADATFYELMKMCKTLGQIRRVLPELVDFMPLNVKQTLAKQVRASSAPYEWSAFDRSRVEQLTDTMAKCLLMSENSSLTKWSERNQHTWAIINSLHTVEKS